MRLKVLGSAEDALRAMTEQLIEKMNMRGISPFHLALSGAGTAQQMFGLWIREYREKIKWEQLRFYWVDERCVSPPDFVNVSPKNHLQIMGRYVDVVS